MEDNSTRLIQFDNGFKLVHTLTYGARVDYFGVVVNAGSRDDPDGGYGLSHFVEHTLFKGTARRRSCHILNRMEVVGGELNAYTTKESTTIYTVFPSGNLSRAIDLIADLVINSRFPQTELDKEREVVADEIDSYLDMPSEAIYDDFEDMLFAGSGIGHNILGNETALAGFDSSACRTFIDNFYVTGNMVAFYSGSKSPDAVARLVERHFASLRSSDARLMRQKALVLSPDEISRNISIHQAHTIIGSHVCDMFDDRRFALGVLVNILGGSGMNSLLNIELREKRGLVYAVDAASTFLTDAGVFTVYFGCDHEDMPRCRRLIMNVIDRMASKPLAPSRLTRFVGQYIGQMTVAGDNRENAIISAARQALYRSRIIPQSTTVERLRALAPEDILVAAQMIAPDLLSSLTFY